MFDIDVVICDLCGGGCDVFEGQGGKVVGRGDGVVS